MDKNAPFPFLFLNHYKWRVKKFKSKFFNAGQEYSLNYTLSEETYSNLIKPPFTKGAYKVFLNNFWEGEKKKGEDI